MASGNLHLDLGKSIILGIEMVPSPECPLRVPNPELCSEQCGRLLLLLSSENIGRVMASLCGFG